MEGTRLRSLLGGSIGNLIEWYDWLAYSTFSLYFAKAFFPAGDRTAQLMNAAAVFAVGYVMRPLGALLFGWYADRRGRRSALTLSIFLMCGGSLLVAVTPGYTSIGIAAPGLLVLARLLQGLSVGGEYGTSAAYLMEVSPVSRRGFFVSFHYLTLLGGQLVAILVLVVLQYWLLTPAQLGAWGWRIPFVVGSVLALAALWIRRGILESPEFARQGAGAARLNPLRLLLRYPRQIVLVAAMTLGGTLAVNTFSVYMPKFLVNTAGFSNEQSTLMSLGLIVGFMAMQPAVGALSDRVGRKPVLIGFGVLGTLCAAPLLAAIAGAHDPARAMGFILLALLITSGYSAVNALVKAELFPVEVRAAGIGIPYAIVVAIFGGSSEWVGLRFKHAGWEQGYYYYVAGCILVSLLAVIRLRETRPSSIVASN
ncbi:MAG TPA: MFS transporter [Steroidobacteraceae bacterium]|nr:MFS transporter [Steroidobacteraceae bacterium]